MRKNRRLRKVMRRLPMLGALAAGAALLHSCGSAEAEARPDPAEVQRFLAAIEAREPLSGGEADAKKGHEKRIRNLVEGAVTRAPSDAAINKLEKVVAGGLG